jgi:hypothetical protein
MSFEVPVSTVAGHGGRRGVTGIALAAAALVVVAALAGRLQAADGPPPQPRPAEFAVTGPASGEPSPTVRPAGVTRSITAVVARRLPDAMTCNDVEEELCERIVRAALRVLPPDLPSVGEASAWRSLVCNDTFDCPPRYLRDSEPLGSVIVGFDDGPSIAVNVVDWHYGRSIRLGPRAWLAHSTPATD